MSHTGCLAKVGTHLKTILDIHYDIKNHFKQSCKAKSWFLLQSAKMLSNISLLSRCARFRSVLGDGFVRVGMCVRDEC